MTARRLVVALIVLAGLIGLGALLHQPLLRAAGQALAVEGPRRPADAIVVVAGSTPNREEAAAALFREGRAPLVVVSRQFVPPRVRRLLDMGIRPHDFQGESVLALERFGVPRAAIVTLDQPVQITETELALVAAAARARGWRRLALVTTWMHSRRVRLIWGRHSDGAIEGDIVPVADECAPPEPWWRRRRCSEVILHEYLGLLALHLRVSSLMR
jgi:uncharacterized SAM-binding protein YcdF (DUF218 family)